MKSLILILTLLCPMIATAATVSGEISGKKIINVSITPKSPVIKYYTGKKGGCYTLVKSKKNRKMIKKYIDKKFCKK